MKTKTKLPRLYKRDSTGALMVWRIATVGNKMIIRYGNAFGKIQRVVHRTEAKNVGRSNATSPEMQALVEARSRWDAQIKDGYVQDRDQAARGEDVIGGIKPMLAHKFQDHKSKITFPCWVQPKLDGNRNVCIVKGYDVKLYSRSRKPINSVPHIVHAVRSAFGGDGVDVILDGELMLGESSNATNFQNLQKIVRKSKEVSTQSGRVDFCVFDAVVNGHFGQDYDERRQWLESAFARVRHSNLRIVPTYQANSLCEVNKLFAKFLDNGHEGAIIRSRCGGYDGKRSFHLLKLKSMEDSEFLIVGVKEGKGTLEGHGIFVCVTPAGVKFRVKMRGPLSALKEVWESKHQYVNRMLTVQYFEMTPEGKPRHPVGLRLRDPE